MALAHLAWGDYDNDGDPDVVVGATGETALYRNDGGTLIRTPTELPVYYEDSDFSTMDLHSLSWADADNDGDLDLLLPSVSGDFEYAPTVLLRNDGPGASGAWVFTDASAPLSPTSNGVSTWGDMDDDGDLDLLLGNVTVMGENFLNTYRNGALGLAVADTGLAHIRYGMADWGDVDNDGDFDIVVAGNLDRPDGTGETVVRVLRSDGLGGYSLFDVADGNFSNPNEPWLDFNAVTWADYDSDGDVDLLVSGQWLGTGEIFGRALVYVNNGGTFTAASQSLPAPVAGNAGGAFTWFDVDGDGDLDYFVAGGYYVQDGNGLIEARTQLFRNDAQAVNTGPTAPSGLSAVPVGAHDVQLAWNPALDDRTPQVALTYDLELTPLGTPAMGERALPEPGNLSRNHSWTLRDLPSGSYGWSVRAVDNAFNRGPAATGTLILGASAVGEPVAGTGRLMLAEPSPNPFNPVTTLRFELPTAGTARLAVYDLAGRLVRTLVDSSLPAGRHEVVWDGCDASGRALGSGSYIAKLEMGRMVETTRMGLVK